ncbi:MAG: MBL fold metallo-hydrolase [Planctomycetota bacterium]|nr:MAG: MBL fold metallo-hydrolase [Planctomycetota bacterium]
MRVRFWGVRGGIAATRQDAQGIGGNTPCVELRDRDGHLLILDAGIGLYWLGRSLLAGPLGRGKGEATILLTHSHWDHIQGFPFFVPAFIPGNRIDIWGGGVATLRDVLEGQMSGTYSPIDGMANMGASIEVGDLSQCPVLERGRFRITHAHYRNGPHDMVGYRIEEDGKSLCYISEADHRAGLDPTIVELARGVDVLVHEAFYTDEELAAGGNSLAGPSGPPSGGHCSFGQATEVAIAAGAQRLHYFYHHPDHSDADIHAAVAREREKIAARGLPLRVEPAREGLEFQV